jgi:uncharacterized membrane protein
METTTQVGAEKLERKGAEETLPESVNVGPMERNASVVGGTGLAAYGVTSLLGKHWLRGVALALAGSYLVYRGTTGRCEVYRGLGISTNGHDTGFRIKETVRIDRPPEEVFRHWQSLENLPNYMDHLVSVKATGKRVSHWVAKTPGGKQVEWDAEITELRENEYIKWRSLAGSDIRNEGQIAFEKTPEGGTEAIVDLVYYPPGGPVGSAAAKLFHFLTHRHIRKNLQQFKESVESGQGRSSETVWGT